MNGYKLAQWAGHPCYLENSAGNPLYKEVVLDWKKPTPWAKNQRVPLFSDEEAFLYVAPRSREREAT